MFQRAEPEEPGLGVMISTPGLTRSSQVSMPSGLPARTTKTTTEEVAMPLVGVVLPVLGDQALVDQAGHVGLERVVDDVGVGAGHDGAALVARGAVRRLELDALALRRCPVKSSKTGSLAASMTENALTVDRLAARSSVAPLESVEQALRASTPASDAATSRGGLDGGCSWCVSLFARPEMEQLADVMSSRLHDLRQSRCALVRTCVASHPVRGRSTHAASCRRADYVGRCPSTAGRRGQPDTADRQ